MGVKFQTTPPRKEHARFSLQNSCILLGRVSTKGVKRISETASQTDQNLDLRGKC